MKLLKKSLSLILVLLCVVSLVTAVPLHVHAASASDYISTSYASSLTVKTTEITALMTFPTKDSTQKYTIDKNTILNVKALHKNTEGTYWYEVKYYNETLYVSATATTMVAHLTGDVVGTDMVSPANISYGASFYIGGTVSATNNKLGVITASAYKGIDLTRIPSISSSDTATGQSYNLTSSTVDKNLYFSSLSTGSYTYVVTAEAVSYYIDDNDKLQTSKTSVVVEKKIFAVTPSSGGNPVLNNGIDVSVWNGNITWSSVKSQVDFVIMRASWEYTADTKFATNAQGCEANGIPYGVYVYSYADNVEEAKAEANAVVSILDGYDLDLPVFYDWEDEICVNLSYATQRACVKAFCDIVADAGYQPGLYTYIWLMNSAFTEAYFKSIPIWVAEIRSSGASYCTYTGPIWMWQWSWTGRFTGMSGDVDCNKLYVDLPTKSRDTSYLSQCTYYPSNMDVTTIQECNMRQYPSSTHTLLSSIPNGTQVHVTGLYKNTYGNLWYQVEYGGKTGYIGAEYVKIDKYRYDDVAVKNPEMADNLAVGKGYYIKGDLSSTYNDMTKISAKVYLGEDTLAAPLLNSTVSVGKRDYSLYKSSVDYGLYFSNLSEGYYTYEISSDVTMYYYNNGSLASKTENVVVWQKPFTVGNASIETPDNVVCNHEVVVDAAVAPGCTTTGLTEGNHCSKCGLVITSQEEVPAAGHTYTSETVGGTCINYGHTLFTCTKCGDSYEVSDQVAYSEWSDTKPDVEESRIQTKTQYRYSNYETKKVYDSELDGYEFISKDWTKTGSGSINYVKSWPSGFDTSHNLYSTYNNSPLISSESATDKIEIASDKANGWLYYHWCRGTYENGPINRTTSATKADVYVAFHAFYSTEDPSTKDKGNAIDGSVINGNADVCKDAYWFYNVPVYKQTYNIYKMQYVFGRWTNWSQWSDTVETASDTKKVETRTMYRYNLAEYGDHDFVNGKCTYCGKECAHTFEQGKCTICSLVCSHVWRDGVCTICSLECTHKWKNGICSVCAFVCEHDYENAVCKICSGKCSHEWTDGICDHCKIACVHNFVNGYCSVCEYPCTHSWEDGKCTICSYNCKHEWEDGKCTICSKECVHTYVNGICSTCLQRCEHSYVDSKCEVCGVNCSHVWKDGVCTQCDKVCEHGWRNGVCSICNTVCDHHWHDGVCSVCTKVCAHTWKDGTCTECGMVCEHEYTNGTCNICGVVCKDHNWENSTCTICSKKCTHAFVDGVCNICNKECEHNYVDSVCTVCSKLCTHNWYYGTCLDCGKSCEHRWVDGICEICQSDCDHEFIDSECTGCGKVCEDHVYINGTCSICSKTEPLYYLCGYINGADYGINDDIDNLGDYKFEDGKLVVTFTENSYVAVKSGNNEKLYMTNGYQGDNVSLAILYNTTLIENGDKLFVPKGREITFTLVDNGNETLVLSYTAAACGHITHSADGVCDSCGAQVKHTYKDGACSVCNAPCDHSFTGSKCTVCGYNCTHDFEDSLCKVCGQNCVHTYTEGVCDYCGAECDHLWTNGKCYTCDMYCKHDFVGNKCSICLITCNHSYNNGVCDLCGVVCPHEFESGHCKECGKECEHSFTNGSVCDLCGETCKHNFQNFKCTLCNATQYYLVGDINNTQVGYDSDYENNGNYAFVDGSVTVTFKYESYVFLKTCDNAQWYMAKSAGTNSAVMYNTKTGKASEMMYIPGGLKAKLTVVQGNNDTLIISYEILSCSHTKHNMKGLCIACGTEVEHTYANGGCTVCSAPKPLKDMYLFGYINGKNYACEGDAENIGIYKFVDGKLTVTFNRSSYVAVKTGDNSDWYMTDGWVGESATSAIMYNTAAGIEADKLYVPAGVELVFTLVYNGDDTFTLSYEEAKKPVPEIKTKYITLNYTSELKYKVGFDALNMQVAPADMGIAFFTAEDAQGTVLTASKILQGVTLDGNTYVASTEAIHPMYMGDTVYFKVYARLADGSYVYSEILSYSAVRYANAVLANKNSSDLSKGMVVAMLNYGAEMQKYYGYNTDNLANAGLTAKQQSYAYLYASGMVEKSKAADSEKAAEFTQTGGNVMVYPTASFDDTMLALNYNLITTNTPDSDVMLYFWTEQDYADADKLTTANASGSVSMTKDSKGVYTGTIEDIAIADINDTVYVAVVYTSGGETYSSGVIAYSAAEFFAAHANKNTSDIKALSKAAVVYSYYLGLLEK